ncbi:efflux RND transporter permease subunit [Anaeromyxobacter paludicola]|uniref:Cation transporter n=1 Tax=Anaeromyxobacter paludicola TaxID=2918171 RepID=A0ABM7XED8_9BACT|nr:CusA/CzcA family heavy metal efflux RND transporter [Anaeromyxobacter paludicola]BDG10225.1 cation transporter [Anaeromyxobacter paludicola]
MIAALVAWSVRNRTAVLVLVSMLMTAGAVVGSWLRFDAMPDITTNQVLVLTRAPGLTPEEVERLVSRPIEAALGGMPGLQEQRSLSRYGISSVTAVFEDGVDPWLARQMAQERLNGLASGFPAGVERPELGPVTGGLGEIFHFTLSSPRRTAAELLELATYRVAPRLRAVPGVVEVNTWGGQQRTLEVRADPVRMAQRGLTLDDVKEALDAATGTAAGASLAAGSGQTLLRAVSLPRDASDLAHALVYRRGAAGPPVRLADVAELSQGETPRIGAATANGRGETVYLMAQMLRGENALQVMKGVHARMERIRQDLPDDVRVDVVYDRSRLVQGTLHTVFKNLIEGGLLVIAVLFLMLGSLRAGLLVASAIPLSMLGATAAMVALDVPGNLMSLGALDFGLLVDGAVVMVESVYHGVGPTSFGGGPEARDGMRAHVARVTRAVAQPVFFSVLIILLVYVPVLTLTGADGKMFRPMALTVVFALLTSLLLSLTYIPAGASLFLRARDIPARPPPLVRLVNRTYLPFLAFSLKRPWAVLAGSLALLAAGGLAFHRAGSEFVPQLDEGDLVVQTTRAADVSLDSAVREAGRLEEAVLRRVPEVTRVVSRVGSPAVATDIMGLEQADVFMSLKPRAEWRPGLEREALIAQIDKAIAEEAKGAEVSFTQPIQMRFNELLGGSVADVTVSVYGDDLDQLRSTAEYLAAVVSRERGAEDVRILAPPAVSLLEVRPRPLDASRAGFTVRSVLDAVQAVRTGLEVGATWDGPLRIPIVLRLGGPASAFTVADLSLPAPSGGLVRLASVADVVQGAAPSMVSRQDAERRLIVGFNVRGADLGSVVAAAQASAARNVPVPRGYRLEWGGQYETLEAAKRRLAVVIPVVMVGIVVVLLIAFRRLRPAAIIFLNVPFASVGGMLALASRGMPVSISAAVGFIALSGVAVLNGVVLMTRLLALEEEGRSPAEAAAEAARERARPVLMTALVAALGFIPMTLATGVGSEVQRPLATVVCGGLVTSTILTLLVLPALYPWLAGRRPAQAAPPPLEEEGRVA